MFGRLLFNRRTSEIPRREYPHDKAMTIQISAFDNTGKAGLVTLVNPGMVSRKFGIPEHAFFAKFPELPFVISLDSLGENYYS